MLSPRTLLSILLLASPALGQADCSTAVVLDPCGGDLVNLGTPTDSATPCGSFSSAWARMTPSRSGPLAVTNFGSGGGMAAIYTGSCGSLTLLQCGSADYGSPQTFNAVEGTTYYFQVEGFFGSVAPILHASVVDPNCAPNDRSECLQAQPIDSCGGDIYAFDTAGGVDESFGCLGPPSLTEGRQWYEIVPAGSGLLSINVTSLAGPGFNLLMYIYEGDCSHLIPIACEDYNNSPVVSVPVVAGTRYTIMLGAVLGDLSGIMDVSALPGSPCGPCADCDADSFDLSVDCDDGNSDVYPGAPEIMGNGVDDDCNGIVDDCSDCDGDGFPAPGDCDDMNPNVNPGMPEIWGNGIDDNCNGIVDEPQWLPTQKMSSPVRWG